MPKLNAKEIEAHPLIRLAQRRGFLSLDGRRVTYVLADKKSYEWKDPEEWVRAYVVAFLVLEKGYPPTRMGVEVSVPRRTPSDFADVVIYEDDACKEPYLVVECKAAGGTDAQRRQAVEQAFGNANSLRAKLALQDDYYQSTLFDVAGFPAGERQANIRGDRLNVPEQYGAAPEFAFVAGPGNHDISPAEPRLLESKIRRTHTLIWSGGKRDPLASFEEWSKLLFAKVFDERHTANDDPRSFQIGTGETTAAVANRVHALFDAACRDDRSIFPEEVKIDLPDKKIFDCVKVLQDVSITNTSVDSVGAAFESFFGSVFRGELGQYFTMRQIARFAVAMLGVSHTDYVIDPTAGSGGFLLEVLLQVWHKLDASYAGREELSRYRNDFALNKVFGIEIHPTLARICKINLLLHHDGHTNVEGDRSALDTEFSKNRLQSYEQSFTCVVGNPPFGDKVEEGDEDILGANSLQNFVVAAGRSAVPSEHVILERSIAMLEPGGRLGLVIPDGLLNNQGEQSNCPAVRRFLASQGVFEAIVSLPDYAFRKSGAQNKTSLLFFRKFTEVERARFDEAYDDAEGDPSQQVRAGLAALRYKVFLGEARYIGYTPSGAQSEVNDLYHGEGDGQLAESQDGTILGEYRRYCDQPGQFVGRSAPDCMSLPVTDLWDAHESHRLDPKYFLFKMQEHAHTPDGWVRLHLSDVLARREDLVVPEDAPDQEFKVMSISQTGEISQREAGKGRNPPAWLGQYFESSTSKWYAAQHGDVVFSSIDLWKGCVAVVPEEFDGALVTKEFPIYRITDSRLDPRFLSCLLRSRYYQRAFRAITTGHSNRRRTQTSDFEALEIAFPPDPGDQLRLVADVLDARTAQHAAREQLRGAMLALSAIVDGRGDEPLPEDLDAADEDPDSRE